MLRIFTNLFFACFCVFSVLEAQTKSFTISIAPETLRYVKGVPGNVEVVIQNASEEVQPIIIEGIWYLDGNVCGEMIGDVGPPGSAVSSGETPVVSIGWTIRYQYVLATRCDLSESGSYQLEYHLPNGYHNGPPADPLRVTVFIEEPKASDLNAFQALQECYRTLVGESLGPCYSMLLKDYPESIYTAWMLFPYLGQPEGFEPDNLKKLIGQAEYPYPTGNSVPDIKYGFRDISDGEPIAKWQSEWAKKILKSHPDFSFAERLQLVLAINKLVVGDDVGAQQELHKLSSNKSEIGEWVRKFLALR